LSIAGALTGCAANATPEATRTTSSHLNQTDGDSAARGQRGALLSAVYAGIFSHPISDDVYNYWVDRYNPAAGVTCRAIVQAFMLADPQRALAMNATNDLDPDLTGYVDSLFAGVLPWSIYGQELVSDPGVTTGTLADWYLEGQMSMDRIEAVFLDATIFKRRCADAGMQ
jgi:hypothetical protein